MKNETANIKFSIEVLHRTEDEICLSINDSAVFVTQKRQAHLFFSVKWLVDFCEKITGIDIDKNNRNQYPFLKELKGMDLEKWKKELEEGK